jgi:2Fe-2S ferredoxin
MTFVLPDGSERTVTAPEGTSLLEIARRHDIAIEGACGGAMACATCHVVVDERFYDLLDPPAAEEEDMLDLAQSLAPTSRLGCQIRLTAALDGLVVRVPRTSLLSG